VDVENEIEELKELVKENIEATEENTRLLRKMRRGAVWGWAFYIVWWLIVGGVTGAAYYYYVQPYVVKVERLYGLSQQQTQSWNDQVNNFLKFFSQQNQQRGSQSQTSTSTTAQ
jgi:uncharacterized membrane protein